MIPVRRGPEPDELQEARDCYLARATLLYQGKQSLREALEAGYPCALEALWHAQGRRCAFCERALREGDPVEHFRPRSVYWWLAWTWGNLFASCNSCNGHKGGAFELLEPETALGAFEMPPGRERPMLLDPSDPSIHPMDCMAFSYDAEREQWRPHAVAGDMRAEHTIERLHLAKGSILTDYKQHIELFEPLMGDVEQAVVTGAQAAVQVKWKRLVGIAFSPIQPLHGLMHCVIASRFPDEMRARWGLALGRPCEGSPPDPPSTEVDNTALEGLPSTLALRVRAYGRRAEPVMRDEVIVALCAHAPQTCSALALVLRRRDVRHLKVLLERLVVLGHLTCDGERYDARR